MSPDNRPPAVPSLVEAREALTRLATQDALDHLKAALGSLERLASSLDGVNRLPAEEKRQLERSLLRFRTELRAAGTLTDRGLAYCQDWAQQLQPPAGYQANGIFTNVTVERHELSLDA